MPLNSFPLNAVSLNSTGTIRIFVSFEEQYSSSVTSDFVENYGDVIVPVKKYEELYFDTDSIFLRSQEGYENCAVLYAYFQEKYGSKPSVIIFFQEKYSDFSEMVVFYQEKYSDFLERVVSFQEKYDQSLPVLKNQEEFWNIFSSMHKSFSELYGISAFSIEKYTEELYNLEVMNRITKEFISPYYLLEGATVHYVPSLSLYVNGDEVEFTSLSIEMGLDKYCIMVDLVVPTLTEYAKCPVLSEVVLIIDGTTYNLFIENREKSSSFNGYTYTVHCLSETAKLDSPYSDPIVQNYSVDVLASVIIQQMADTQSIVVENNLIDWYLSPISFFIQDETPLQVIKRIVNSVGGIMQTKPDGTLLLISEYQISPKDWETSTPEGIFSFDTNILQYSESTVINSGNNAFIVTDQSGAEKGITLEEEDIDSTTKIIKGFQIPFNAAKPFTLQTSGGTAVSIVKETNPVIEQIPDAVDEWEIVEFVEKTGKTKYPIYKDSSGIDIIDYDWIEDDLGTISYEEDGTLTVDSIKTESLLKIKYNTKYWKWTVTGVMDKYTQFYVPSL